MNLLEIASAGAAVVAAGCALYATFRATSWRRSDEWRALTVRVEKAERWELSTRAVALFEQVSSIGRMASKTSERLEWMATKADLAGFQGEVRGTLDGISRQLQSTENAISRVEGFMMEKTP